MQETLPSPSVPGTRGSFSEVLHSWVTAELSLLQQLTLCAVTILATIAIGWAMHDEFHLTAVLLCLVASIFVSVSTGRIVTVMMSLVSGMAADYFFIGPVGRVTFDFHFMLREVVFLSTSLLANALVGMLRKAYFESTQVRLAAEAANREKDEILAILSHDLRAPLTAAQLSLQMIERTIATDDPIRRHTGRARDACRRVNSLVLDLLDSSRAAAGGLAVHRERQDAAPLVRAVESELHVLAHQAGVTLDFSTEPCELLCDGQRITQLVTNLVTNSLKFTPRGGKVSVALAAEPGWAEIIVRDSGIGMDEHQLSHLFERFWQAKRTSRSGVGLGLFIVKAIAEAHGGKVEVESRPHHGTCFTVRLPR